MRLPFSEYRSLVGSMLYLAVTSRPDISFAVCQLSRVMSNPSKAHWNEVLVLLRYLSLLERRALCIVAMVQRRVLLAISRRSKREFGWWSG